MSEHFIYFGFAFITIYLLVIFTLAPYVNRYDTKKKSKLFKNIEKHKGKVTEELFNDWKNKYDEISGPKNSLKACHKFGVALIGVLFFAYIISQTQLEDLINLTYGLIVIFGITYGIVLVSLVSWRIKQKD